MAGVGETTEVDRRPGREVVAGARAAGPWALVAATAAVDLASKAWAHAHLHPGGPPGRLGPVMNRGAGLGLGADHPHWVLVASAAALLALTRWLTRAGTRLEGVGIALALGGGAGNLADRLAHGAVTDWVHVPGYAPWFNLADVAIRLGLVVALVGLVFGRPGRRRAR